MNSNDTVEGWKAICDTVHSDVQLPKACYHIMDTPQFQRLRYIKQIGSYTRVYPSAGHTWFAHSIGVAHLAGKYGEILQRKQPQLNINFKDILCLYIAGLCHDLGQGPFSQSWTLFMKRSGHPNYSTGLMSVRMLEFLLDENDLIPILELSEDDMVFIKELILGRPLELENDGTLFHRRPQTKQFLYQIITNLSTRIDVDSFDTVLRDCKQLGIETTFDPELVMNNSRIVSSSEGIGVLAYSHNILDNLLELVRVKEQLLSMTSGRLVGRVIEEMVVDVLLVGDASFIVSGKSGQTYKLSEAYKDLSAFAKLTDTVADQIYNWGNGGPDSRRLLDDIIKRKLYETLGCLGDEDEELVNGMQKLNPDQIVVLTCGGFGSEEESPLNRVLFYGKHSKSLDHSFHEKFANISTKGRSYVILKPRNCAPVGEGSEDVVELTERVTKYLGTALHKIIVKEQMGLAWIRTFRAE